MSKMNQNIRMTKAITGHKSATPIKGTSANYKVTTNVGDSIATVTNAATGALIGVTTASVDLKETMQKVREGLVSLGVKFPILQAADVPLS